MKAERYIEGTEVVLNGDRQEHRIKTVVPTDPLQGIDFVAYRQTIQKSKATQVNPMKGGNK